MNAYELRNNKMLVSLTGLIGTSAASDVMAHLNNLEPFKLRHSQVQDVVKVLDAGSLLKFVRFGGHQEVDDQNYLDCVQALFKLEIEERFDQSFNVWCSGMFGNDWEDRLNKPRGSQSVASYKATENYIKPGHWDADPESGWEAPEKMKIKRSHEVGRALISLNPIEIGKHPMGTINDELGEREVEVHTPGLENIECSLIVQDKYLALQLAYGGRKISGDMVGGGTQQFWITGLVEHYKGCKCGKVGYVAIGEELYNINSWNEVYKEFVEFSAEEQNPVKLEALLRVNPLEMWYRENFPELDARKLTNNSLAGVKRDKLTKDGRAPLSRLKRKSEVLHQQRFDAPQDVETEHQIDDEMEVVPLTIDEIRDSQNMDRWIANNIDGVIRRLLGRPKLRGAEWLLKFKSATLNEDGMKKIERMLANDTGENDAALRMAAHYGIKTETDLDSDQYQSMLEDVDIAEFYDEIDPESGLTFYERAMKELAKRYVSSNKQTVRVMEVTEKSAGKMIRSKSNKLRNGDKSTTVNGARAAVLTKAFLVVQITLPKEVVVNIPCSNKDPDAFSCAEEFKRIASFGSKTSVRYNGILSPASLIKVLKEVGFNMEEFMVRRLTAEVEEYGRKSVRPAGLKDSEYFEQIMTRYFLRVGDLSAMNVIHGHSPWMRMQRDLVHSSVEIMVRHVDGYGLRKLQDARKLVLDAGQEATPQNIRSAMIRPRTWELMIGSPAVKPFDALKSLKTA